MFCTRCGTPNDDDALFCSNCGAPMKKEQPAPVQPPVAQPVVPPTVQAPVAPQPVVPPVAPQPAAAPIAARPAAPALEAKWWMYILDLFLGFTAVMNAVHAFTYLSGSAYGSREVGEMVHAVYRGLGAIDTIFGLCMLVLAVLSVVSVLKLNGYKANAGKVLKMYHAGCLGAIVIYYIAVMSITHISLDALLGWYTVVLVLFSAVALFYNRGWFEKNANAFNR